MNLFDEIARALRMRGGDKATEIAEFRASLAVTQDQLIEFDDRLKTVEAVVEQFVSVFEKKLDNLAARGS